MGDESSSLDEGHEEGSEDVTVGVFGFCKCFNCGDFYEAHDILEEVWLPRRRTREGELWKGLIQLAAAFVHVQRGRKGPALSLLRASRQRLREWTQEAAGVDLPAVIRLAEDWEGRVGAARGEALPALLETAPPRIRVRR